MRRDIRDFYDLKRQRVRRPRSKREDKPIHEMKIPQIAPQPSAFQPRGFDSHMKVTGMLVVSLRGENCRFYSHLIFLLIQVSLKVNNERKLKIYDNASKIQ